MCLFSSLWFMLGSGSLWGVQSTCGIEKVGSVVLTPQGPHVSACGVARTHWEEDLLPSNQFLELQMFFPNPQHQASYGVPAQAGRNMDNESNQP